MDSLPPPACRLRTQPHPSLESCNSRPSSQIPAPANEGHSRVLTPLGAARSFLGRCHFGGVGLAAGRVPWAQPRCRESAERWWGAQPAPGPSVAGENAYRVCRRGRQRPVSRWASTGDHALQLTELPSVPLPPEPRPRNDGQVFARLSSRSDRGLTLGSPIRTALRCVRQRRPPFHPLARGCPVFERQ